MMIWRTILCGGLQSTVVANDATLSQTLRRVIKVAQERPGSGSVYEFYRHLCNALERHQHLNSTDLLAQFSLLLTKVEEVLSASSAEVMFAGEKTPELAKAIAPLFEGLTAEQCKNVVKALISELERRCTTRSHEEPSAVPEEDKIDSWRPRIARSRSGALGGHGGACVKH